LSRQEENALMLGKPGSEFDGCLVFFCDGCLVFFGAVNGSGPENRHKGYMELTGYPVN
jgi:hypothetical protein